MADINSRHSSDTALEPAYAAGGRSGAPSSEPGTVPAEPALIGLVELLFFAYHDFTGEADAVLAEFEFGRAHHRVLHFVNRQPGLRVADLLDILRITKQSLARVLKELVERSFIVQAAGAKDKRERRLYLTPTGKALAVKLARLQMAQIGRALAEAGRGSAGNASHEVVRAFLLGIVESTHRDAVAAAIAAGCDIAAEHVVFQGGEEAAT